MPAIFGEVAEWLQVETIDKMDSNDKLPIQTSDPDRIPC